MAARRLPHLALPPTKDAATSAFFQAVKEYLEVSEGDRGSPKARFVTIEELEQAGLVTTTNRGSRTYITGVSDQLLPTSVAELVNLVRGTSQTSAVLLNRFTLTELANGYFFIHGFRSDGTPSAVDGAMVYDGVQVSVPSGSAPTSQAISDGGWIMVEAAWNVTIPPFQHTGTNARVAAVRKTRLTWEYDNGTTWTSFVPTSTMLVIGTYTAGGTPHKVLSAAILGNAIVPESIPVQFAHHVYATDIQPLAISGMGQFANNMRPIEIVGSLPTLSPPDPLYPEGTVVYLNSDEKLYRNVGGSWSRAVDGRDLEDGTVIPGKLVVGPTFGAALNSDPLFQDTTVAAEYAGVDGTGETTWFEYSSGTSHTDIVEITDGSHVSGTRALRNTSSSYSVECFDSKLIPVDYTKTYYFSGYIRKVTGAATNYCYFVVRFFDREMRVINAALDTATGWASLGSWHYPWSGVPSTTFAKKKLSFGFNGDAQLPQVDGLGVGIPKAAAYMQVGVILNYFGGTAGIYEVQDVRITEQIGSGLIETNAIVADKIAADAVTADKIYAGSISAAKLASDIVLATLFRTASSGTRVELEGNGHVFPFWIGNDTVKGTVTGSPGAGAKFWYDKTANEVGLTGRVKSSSIETSYLVPSASGVLPVRTTAGLNCDMVALTTAPGGYTTPPGTATYTRFGGQTRFYHPNAGDSTNNYRRLQEVQQTFLMWWLHEFGWNTTSSRNIRLRVMYDYDAAGTWTSSVVILLANKTHSGSIYTEMDHTDVFAFKPKASGWSSTLDIQLAAYMDTGTTGQGSVWASGQSFCGNLGSTLPVVYTLS